MDKNRTVRLATSLVAIIVIGTQSAATRDVSAPPTPVFASNYHVRGLLSLP
jgi:hypothetical protein